MWDKVITRKPKQRAPKSDGYRAFRTREKIADNEACYQVWLWLDAQDAPDEQWRALWAVTEQREAKRSWGEILAAIRAGQLR